MKTIITRDAYLRAIALALLAAPDGSEEERRLKRCIRDASIRYGVTEGEHTRRLTAELGHVFVAGDECEMCADYGTVDDTATDPEACGHCGGDGTIGAATATLAIGAFDRETATRLDALLVMHERDAEAAARGLGTLHAADRVIHGRLARALGTLRRFVTLDGGTR